MNRLLEILKPLRRISPSRYTRMNKCSYRVVLANSYSTPLLPYPPANHLGNAIHECIQLIVTGKIRTAVEFDETWNRLLIKEEKKLEDMGFEFFTPLSENVSGYTIKKLQVKSLLKSRVETKVQEDRNTDTKILTEKWLQAKDSLIGGYADIIITRNGYTKLADFKSGKILLEEGEIKEEYEDQLKLYAYLYNEIYGKYPDELSIIDLEKKEYPVVFTPQECEVIASDARDTLSRVNSLIEVDQCAELAKPDLNTCRSCLYRPACKFYWKLPLSETDSRFRDVMGTVSKVRQFRNGNLNVTLNKDGTELTVSHISHENLTFMNSSVGKELAFYNVKQGSTPDIYKTLKITRIYEV